MKRKGDPAVIAALWDVICERADNPVPGSCTNRLLSDETGIDCVLQKISEESTELILALKNGRKAEISGEASDLIYHVLRGPAAIRNRPCRWSWTSRHRR